MAAVTYLFYPKPIANEAMRLEGEGYLDTSREKVWVYSLLRPSEFCYTVARGAVRKSVYLPKTLTRHRCFPGIY